MLYVYYVHMYCSLVPNGACICRRRFTFSPSKATKFRFTPFRPRKAPSCPPSFLSPTPSVIIGKPSTTKPGKWKNAHKHLQPVSGLATRFGLIYRPNNKVQSALQWRLLSGYVGNFSSQPVFNASPSCMVRLLGLRTAKKKPVCILSTQVPHRPP